ncbi:hypothetical protein OG21DRAFT_1604027 [Imleria badia]|nr:hypothetical protein OG21DRAFT_1604027 [Imleria badia]
MASLQQVVEQLASLAANGTNETTGSDATSAPRGPLDPLTSIFKMLLSASALRIWVILLIIGGLFGMARRFLSSLWYALINVFFITATFEEYDDRYDWIMYWLSKQPSWTSTLTLPSNIDAAFHHGLNRESTHTSDGLQKNPDMQCTSNSVSLSGLLNALDGIGAQEGCVLFGPGRMDLHVEFKLTSRFQVEELFKRFHALSSSASASVHGPVSEKRQNGDVDLTRYAFKLSSEVGIYKTEVVGGSAKL